MNRPLLPARAWLRRRLAKRFARLMAQALSGAEERCRIDLPLATDADLPPLPPQWPAHRRLRVQTSLLRLRRRYAWPLRLAYADRMVFSLDRPPIPRLRLWIGRNTQNASEGALVIVIVSPSANPQT